MIRCLIIPIYCLALLKSSSQRYIGAHSLTHLSHLNRVLALSLIISTIHDLSAGKLHILDQVERDGNIGEEDAINWGLSGCSTRFHAIRARKPMMDMEPLFGGHWKHSSPFLSKFSTIIYLIGPD